MKIKSVKDIRRAGRAGGFRFKKIQKLTAEDVTAEDEIYQAREVSLSELESPIKPLSPSFLKRKAKKHRPLGKRLERALAKFGGKGASIATHHSEYYTARGAAVLLKLKTTPVMKYPHEMRVSQKLIFSNLKNGRYLITRNGIPDFKTYTWKQIEKKQRAQNRRIKIEKIAARIGVSPFEVRRIIKKIEGQERKRVKRFKKTAAYRKHENKKSVTIKRRMAAILGAMADLLEIHGSPKAQRENAAAAHWKKIHGAWCVKSRGKWYEKIGPDKYRKKTVGKKRK